MSRFDKRNTSQITKNDKRILDDFFKRRNVFDEYLRSKTLSLHTCPSCGYPTLVGRGQYEICSICDWEDDKQDDPIADEILGGPNSNLSLTASRLEIGRTLHKLTETLNGTINVNPDEVLNIIVERDKTIESFEEDKITMTTDVCEPVWKELAQLKEKTLSAFIKT